MSIIDHWILSFESCVISCTVTALFAVILHGRGALMNTIDWSILLFDTFCQITDLGLFIVSQSTQC